MFMIIFQIFILIFILSPSLAIGQRYKQLSHKRSHHSYQTPMQDAARLSIKLPVSWEMTRTGFGQNGIASETASYLEVWVLDVLSDYEIYLSSPRYTATVIGMVPFESISRIPSKLAIDESQLASLLGIQYQDTIGDDRVRIKKDYSIYFLDISNDRAENAAQIRHNRDEMISISIDFDRI